MLARTIYLTIKHNKMRKEMNKRREEERIQSLTKEELINEKLRKAGLVIID